MTKKKEILDQCARCGHDDIKIQTQYDYKSNCEYQDYLPIANDFE